MFNRHNHDSSHPAGHDRQLPELPHGTPGSPLLDESSHDYDHLHQVKGKKPSIRADNYDHVQIKTEDGGATANPPANNMYAEVKAENIYSGIKDDEETESIPKDTGKQKEHYYAKVDGDKESKKDNKDVLKIDKKEERQGSTYSHYASVNDFNPDIGGGNSEVIPGAERISKEDPYSKVDPDSRTDAYQEKDKHSKAVSDPYNRMNDHPYNDIRDDPYNKVKDDPYSKVKDDPYNKVIDDPYNTVDDITDPRELDDPYSKPNDLCEKGIDEDPYNKVMDDMYSKVREVHRESPSPQNAAAVFQRPPHDVIVDGDYLVIKDQQQTNTVVVREHHKETEGASGVTLQKKDDIQVDDLYATVVKNRPNGTGTVNTPVTNGSGASNSRESNPYILPPEPPRQYGVEDIVGAGMVLIQQGGSADAQPIETGGRYLF